MVALRVTSFRKMAASMNFVGGWRDQLNQHPITKRLKENNAKDSVHKQQNEAKSLFCVYGSDLYIWDNLEGHILHCNLKSLVQRPNPADNGQDSASNTPSISNLGAKNLQDDTPKYQKLLAKDGFSLAVEGINVNKCGSHIVVWSANGIRVIGLPRRWGKNAMFEGGKDVIACRTICIGERTFSSCGRSLRIRQVSWHPGSEMDCHIALLTSDNMFSIYDIHEPDQPLSIVNINTGDISFTNSPSKSFVSAVLGETGVAFDFGSPIKLQPKQRMFQISNKAQPIEVWPVYCVRGNGDIMLHYSHLSHFRQVKLPVQGPLMMYPPAEDNYGVDACSILCLPTPFPVVVISTCEGRVHHCVQLPGTLEDESLQSDTSTISPTSSVSNATNLYEPVPEPVLYVIETAELELCLSLPRFDGEAPLEDEFMCPVRLKKDGNSPDRYHCAHAAGVHSVALPWLNTVQQYFLDEAGDFNMPEEKECVVEHLLCTKPLHSCPTSPVLGMDVVTDAFLGPTLLMLSSDYEFTVLPIGLQYQTSVVMNRDESDADVKVSSPLRHLTREPFSQRVRQILQKRTSNPLLKSGSNTTLSQQDCFQLLSRATQVLREEYIQRQDHARQEIDTRIAILREHKEQQLQDIKRLTDLKPILREHAGTIAEKLETSKENHERLMKRLETVLSKLQGRVPNLSEAEKQMMKELAKIKDNMQLYEQNISQVQLKQEYQDRQIAKFPVGGGLALQKNQLTQIRDILKEEANDIDELKKDISRLNISLS